MTEEEWLSDETSGRLLEHTRRIQGLTPRARGRKYRLAAVEIVRAILGIGSDARVAAVVEAVERLCEEQCTLREVAAAVQATGFQVRSDTWPNWGALVHYLGADEAFSGVRGIAGATQLERRWEGPPMPLSRPAFVAVQCRIIREVFGNPFRATDFDPDWRTDTAVALARQMYESREFSAMPILADALQDAGCDDEEALAHCRDTNQVHVRGCWVVDLVLGRS
jgi:hypothetical protein